MGATLQVQFGRRIQQLRKAAKLTQEQLAKKASLDYKYLGSVERGERNVTLRNVEKIVKALRIEPHVAFIFPLEHGKDDSTNERVVLDLIKNSDPSDRRLLIDLARAVLSRPRAKK